MIIPIALDDSRAIYVSPGLEHNAAILKIKVEERLQGCNKWLAYFQSEVGSVYVTAPIFEGGMGNRYEDGYIYINLVQALTCSSTQTLQLEGIVTNGDVIESIYRSKIYPRIFFDESIDGTPQELGAGVDVITQLVADEHTHDNKEMLDTLDENSFAGLHTHNNKAVLDEITHDENGNLLYENKLLATRTQKLTVTAAYAAEVSATAIPAVEADPGNGVEAQDAVEGYYTISPNVMYDFGETTSLNLQLAPGVGGYVNEYMFRFSCGETAATFALPDCIEWIGSEPEMVANKIYECSIVDNRAVIA